MKGKTYEIWDFSNIKYIMASYSWHWTIFSVIICYIDPEKTEKGWETLYLNFLKHNLMTAGKHDINLIYVHF